MTSFRIFLTFLFSILFFAGKTQTIIGIIMVGDHGITKNADKAKYLLALKKYDDTTFELLDYYFAGPMRIRKTYSDSSLTILNGTYSEYNKKGVRVKEGNYTNNKKNGSWYLFNDTSRATFEYKYHFDSLYTVINIDSLDKENAKLHEDTTGEYDATYKGGEKAYTNFITSNLKVPDRTASLTKGGTVRVQFIVNTDGKPTDIKIIQSVEFAFDEECLRLIALASDWTPAFQRGKKVKAYRVQPISVKIE